MRKRILSLLLSCAVMFSALPVAYAIDWFSVTQADGGILSVTSSNIMTGKLIYSIYRDGELINIGRMTVQGLTETEVGLPINKLPMNDYEINIAYYNGANEKVAEETVTMTLGVDNPVLSGDNTDAAYIAANPIETMRAIMAPYAKVYSSATLTGQAVVELKRHDIVRVKSITNRVAAVSYMIQSGNGTITPEDDVNALYESDDDLVGDGYMSIKAFQLEALSYESDLQREAVELAYSRLGAKGVYSQSRRYMDYYLDCAAMVCWCWHQVGVDVFNGTYTSCNGIANWAQGQTDNVILWAATEDYLAVQTEWASIKSSHGVGTMTSIDIVNITSNEDETTTSTLTGETTSESKVLDYVDSIDRTVWEALEPGDILFFNHKESLSYTHEHDDGNGGTYTCTFGLGTHFINEDGSGAGYDHVAIVVGFASDGNGGENKNILTIIETSSPSFEASKNTKVSTISYSTSSPTSSRVEEIKMVVRPTGCERLDPTGITETNYSGAYYADIGDLQSPVAQLTAANKGNITGGSRFGYRIHPITGQYKLHTGIDISGNVGASLGTTVTAAADGEVIFVFNGCPHTNYGNTCSCGSYGNYVIIQHSDTTKTLYAHLQQNVAVYAGQIVHAGDVIGTIGSSGSSTGPHLHFEVRYNNVPTDPLQYIN